MRVVAENVVLRRVDFGLLDQHGREIVTEVLEVSELPLFLVGGRGGVLLETYTGLVQRIMRAGLSCCTIDTWMISSSKCVGGMCAT